LSAPAWGNNVRTTIFGTWSNVMSHNQIEQGPAPIPQHKQTLFRLDAHACGLLAQNLKVMVLALWSLVVAAVTILVASAGPYRQLLLSRVFSVDEYNAAVTATNAIGGLLLAAACVLGTVALWRTVASSSLPPRAGLALLVGAAALVTGTLLFLVGLALGGARGLEQLPQIWSVWRASRTVEPVCLLHLAGAGLCSLSLFPFNYFLLLLSRSLGYRLGELSAMLYAMAWSVLLGLAASGIAFSQRLSGHREFPLLLLLLLLLCLLWLQARLLRLMRAFSLLAAMGKTALLPTGSINVDELPRRLSGVRRALKAMMK
jgi:hypothetical protein